VRFTKILKEVKAAELAIQAIGDSAQTDMAADAVNHMAFYARTQVIAHMKGIFDRPTPRTLRSIYIKPLATAQKPEAKVYVNDDRNKGASPAQWLRAEEAGGSRRDKRSEIGLKAAGILAADQQTIAVKGAMDNYGNLSGGKIKQMLSALQAGNDGYQDSKDEAKKAKWRIARRRSDGKPFGIFEMKGVHSKLFMVFTRQQQYKSRFKFFDVVQAAWNSKIKEAWAKAFARHVAKSIPAYMRG